MHIGELKVGQRIDGVIPGQCVQILSVRLFGGSAKVTYEYPDGSTDSVIAYDGSIDGWQEAKSGDSSDFQADGKLFQLVSEARRISLAYLFDPYLAVHSSSIQPLPHQISAVYECMLPRHPLRYVLADDPGAGKTIMTGLLLKELIIRGDVSRCLICIPNSA